MALKHIETGAKVPSGGPLTKVQSPSQSNPWKGVRRKYRTIDKEVFETGHAEERNQNWRWKVWLCYEGTTGDIHSFITIELIKSYPMLRGPSRMACWIVPVDGGFCILPELLYRRGLTAFFSIHECGTQMWPPPLSAHGQAGPTFLLPFLPHSRPSSLEACLTQGPWPQELASFLEVLKTSGRSYSYSLKTGCKFFIWGPILPGRSTLVLTAFPTWHQLTPTAQKLIPLRTRWKVILWGNI